jgi:hypothetical protein
MLPFFYVPMVTFHLKMQTFSLFSSNSVPADGSSTQGLLELTNAQSAL